MKNPEIRVVDEGNALIVRSSAEGNPPPWIIWRKVGSRAKSFVQHLEFTSIKQQDSGVYVCQAQNRVGKSKEKTVQITVRIKPTTTTPGKR